MEPKFQVQLKIQKPVAEVFDGVVNPKKLSGYFVQAASAPLVEGTTVKWRFAEAPGEHDVIVRTVARDERIVFEWEAAGGGYNTRVEMLFKPIDARSTLVQIRESGWKEDAQGIEASYDNCGGWMHMMLCLKAYLEFGINLRAGGAY
ncbi:SRPBCC domain-containing protein [Myxococcus sp. CA051A]|uniref:SRPBCC domain-containing protein n=1 Tax=Myxococcus sp. CA051A TaxID=2741739 RepID=UPI00157A7E84|nr:SRPBCC domain-containing protein [Myxococcus sp. CA051A]NTX62986.1 SRPBCC domain-containing protein [Myxococcus sp. CA051A]